MSPRDEVLELYCPRCRQVTGLRFEDSFQDRTVGCASCGHVFYWRSCPVCETGWVTDRPGEPCRECGAA